MNTPLAISQRTIHATIVLISITALSIAFLYMERHLGLAPCPLCVVDRLLLCVIIAFALAGYFHNPDALGQRIYSLFHLVFSASGIAVAARHIHLQTLATTQTPDCLPDLDYMLETFSWLETLAVIFNTSGECASVQWTFLGLSIPQQTLLLFIALFILGGTNLLLTWRSSAKPIKPSAV